LFLHIAVAPDGTVIAVDDIPPGADLARAGTQLNGVHQSTSFRIRLYEPSGTLREQWILQDILPKGTYVAHTGRPAVDSKGVMYLPIFDSIVAIAPDGSFLARIGRGGFDAYDDFRPGNPIVDSLDRLVVQDPPPGWYAPRIHVFAPPESLAWRVSLFDNAHLLGWPATITEHETIDFDWGADPPAELPSAGPFAARAERMLELEAGLYLFELQVEGGARLWVDDRLLVDRWQAGTVDVRVGAMLAAGPHVIQVETAHREAKATLGLRRSRLEVAEQVFLPALRTARR
jgi:hypothetical protein